MESPQRSALTPEQRGVGRQRLRAAEVILQLLGVERAPKDRRKCAGTPRGATNPRTGGRPAQGTAGANPRTGQANRYFFYTAGTLMFILDFSGYVSRARGIYVGGAAGLVYHVPFVLFFALVLCLPLPAARLRGGPSAASLCSLTQRREIYTLPRTLYFIPAVDPSSRAVRRTTTRCLWSQS